MDRALEKPKWFKQRNFWIRVGAGLLLLTIYLAFFREHGSRLNVSTDKLTIDDVKKDTFQDYMATMGTVFPIRTIYLDAMEGGRVEEILIEEGSMVKKGDIILKLNNPNLNMTIMASEADLAEKINFLRNTQVQMEQNKLDLKTKIIDLDYKYLDVKRTYENNKKFYASNLISLDEFNKSKENYDYTLLTKQLLTERWKQDSIYRKIQTEQMEESLARIRENLKLVRLRLVNLDVKAPVDGQLGQLNAEIGEQKTQGQRLGLINDLSAYKIQAEIDEHYISRIVTGLGGDFEFNNNSYNLSVKKVYPEVRNGHFLIDMNFGTTMPENIRAGQTFRLKLQLGESKVAVLVPRGGFYQNTGGQWIYVVDVHGKTAFKRQIKIGRQNPTYYEVLEGLEPGEKVVTSSYETFGDADKLILK